MALKKWQDCFHHRWPGSRKHLFILCCKQVSDYCLISLFHLISAGATKWNDFLFVCLIFIKMCLRLSMKEKPPLPGCNNQLSPHGGDSNYKRQRQQKKQGGGELNGRRSDPSVAVVPVPLGPISFSDSGRLCRVGGRVTGGFVIGRRVRPITWPIIMVPFTLISTPWTAALLTWNIKKDISNW